MNRPAKDPRNMIGKWAVVGKCGGWACFDPDCGTYSRFASEAILFDTQEEAEGECLPGEIVEKVTGLRRGHGHDINENLHGDRSSKDVDLTVTHPTWLYCPDCGGKMLGDGHTSVMHCENAKIEDYWDLEPDAGIVLCPWDK